MERTEQTQELEFNGIVKQGYVERSNVNAINEMINMITVMRSYEANQKSFKHRMAPWKRQ